MNERHLARNDVTRQNPKTEALEQYLLSGGYVDDRELSLAKKLQAREQGPLLMILLRLNFIDIEQLAQLWDFESAWVS
ncbi:MAG: DUF2949 domain-containing protein [Cyanobacteria bacterium P01_E01_bin.34]